MSYTPVLSIQAQETLRCLSLALSVKPAAVLNKILNAYPALLESGAACSICGEKSACSSCIFNRSFLFLSEQVPF
jgi:hypothetical protein